MQDLRVVYRNPLVESLLLLAVGWQIFSGIKLWRTKKNQTQFFEKIHIWSGLYLAFFLLIHVVAVLTGRFILHLDTNFYFGIASLNAFPVNLFFIPYYTLAVVSFFAHLAAVHHLKMKKPVLGMSVPVQSYIILFSGGVLALLLLYSLTNHFNGFEVPPAYKLLQLK